MVNSFAALRSNLELFSLDNSVVRLSLTHHLAAFIVTFERLETSSFAVAAPL